MSKQRHGHKPIQLVLLILLILIMLVSFSVSFIPIGHAQEPEPEITTTSEGRLCAEDEVLVKFKDTESDTALANTLESLASEPLNNASDIVIADVPEGETVESFVETLQAQSNVEYAQPNYVYKLERTVNDTFIADQWHLNKIGAFNAWDTTMGSSEIKVAVLDTGIDLDHPDLAGQITAQADVVQNDGNAEDDNGHGTHVAGIIGAVADNMTGVAGIAPGVKLIAVDVFGYYVNPETSLVEFGAFTSDVIEGIEYAVTHGADVVNMSLGGSEYDSAFEEAVDAAVNAGVVIVAAAGNENENGAHYPSDFNSCISVVATDQNDLKADFSNYGIEKDIAAPGVSILSAFPNDVDPEHPVDYIYMGGTSMASPVVAGVVALMLSQKPGLSVDDIKDKLYSSADIVTDPAISGMGRVNTQNALAAVAAYSPVAVTGVTLNKASHILSVGETYSLTETVAPSDASNNAVIYSSSNPFVASVDYSTGLVTANAAGNADITVTTDDGGFTAVCSILVDAPSVSVTGITLDKSSFTLLPGDSVCLQPTISPANATNQSLTLVSDAPAVATVKQDSTGIVVTAVGEGTATVSVITNDGGYTAACVITVKSRTIKSSVYEVDTAGHYLRNVAPGTTATQLKANLLNDPEDITILDTKGNAYTGANVGTAMAVQLDVYRNGIENGINDSLNIVIRGDTGGDGSISISDYTYIRLHILGLSKLSSAGAAAADADQNGSISISDYTLIRLHILGLKPIY